MLAKMWKKVLLAICIIACIYNIMSKLVNRGSLEANLKRANDGNTVFDFSSKDSNENDSEIVDGVVSQNISVKNDIVEDERLDDEQVRNTVSQESDNQENQPEEEKKSSAVKFTDFIFNW